MSSIVDNWNKNYINHGLDKKAIDDGNTIHKLPCDDDKYEESYGLGKTLPFSFIYKCDRPQRLAHIDEQVWYRYAEQVDSSGGFDIIDFPGVIHETRVVPMNLQTNPEAISRAKAIADSAINIYNNNNHKSFVVVSVDKANCNPELSSFVDSDKYIVHYKQREFRECLCDGGDRSKKCYCYVTWFRNRFYITFTAKEENSDVVKVFQAKAVREIDEDEEHVTFCAEKASQNPPSQDEKKVAEATIEKEASKQLRQNFLERIEKSGLSLLDQPLYPDLEVKNVDIPYVSAIQDPEKL